MMIVFLSLLNPIFSWASTQILWDMRECLSSPPYWLLTKLYTVLKVAVLYLSDSWALRARAMYNLATDPKYHEEVTSYCAENKFRNCHIWQAHLEHFRREFGV